MTAPAPCVLVVEDDPTINQALADRFTAEGFEVVRAHDGPGAVAAHAAHDPAVVVLDLMLPGFDGLEVCRRIQADRPVPVLMLTARDDESDIIVGLGVGADDYLTSPSACARSSPGSGPCCVASSAPPSWVAPTRRSPTSTA